MAMVSASASCAVWPTPGPPPVCTDRAKGAEPNVGADFTGRPNLSRNLWFVSVRPA
ncbi:hypothetical protein ACFFX0_07895 [Citricoccus parietis]|uniref:Uncharacterized protein n=1 Tax=Citricoccus parietis TaxID=592307 RepID=A0ABV5FWQ2_9MICC